MEKTVEKTVGSICLIAGTAIGAGMIALPIVLAKIGITLTIILMTIIWLVMYYTSLVSLELNLQANSGLTLGELGKKFSGPIAQVIGTITFKVLSYSLLAAYLYGGISIIKALISHVTLNDYSFVVVSFFYVLIILSVLALSTYWVERINRILFFGLLSCVGFLLIAMLLFVEPQNMPLLMENYANFRSWSLVLPVMFTAFGFQVIFHTLTNYCNKNAAKLKKVFFWGSLIPLLVYLLWTTCVLCLLYHYDYAFYSRMLQGNVEVGEMIEALNALMHWQSLEFISWIIYILVILTSTIGVSVGLIDSWKHSIKKRRISDNQYIVHALAIFITIIVAYIIVLFIPNAFIHALSFAGMILVIIAILQPIYLIAVSEKKYTKYFYPVVASKLIRWCAVLLGTVIIVCEVINMANMF